MCLWTDCTGGLAECGSCAGVGVEGAPLLLVLAVVVVMLLAVAGVVYSCFVASVVVQRVWQKHYHVLAKRMLAKVRRGAAARSRGLRPTC
jgi:type IV secretory pathway VirB3-like protein